MEQTKIDRIGELSRKQRSGTPLTEEELKEQKALREEYIEGFRRSVIATLDNTYIQRPDGTKEKLKSKKEK